MSIPGLVGYNKTPRTTITCAVAETNVAAAAPIPAGTRRLAIAATAYSFVAFGQPTSATVGLPIPANQVVVVELAQMPGIGTNTVNAQSPTAGAVVSITYLP